MFTIYFYDPFPHFLLRSSFGWPKETNITLVIQINKKGAGGRVEKPFKGREMSTTLPTYNI